MSTDWSVDLPNWRGQPDPEIPGATAWVHTDYDGNPDIALASDESIGWTSVSVIQHPLITPTEIDGSNIGSFADWDTALGFALQTLESM